MQFTVKGYPVRDGESVIDEWVRQYPLKAVSKFHTRLSFMVSRLPQEWGYEKAHKRRGTNGIWEIRFDYGNIAYRPLFFLGPYQEELTLLIFSIEHNNRLKPPGADDTAITRMKKIEESPQRALIYDGHQ